MNKLIIFLVIVLPLILFGFIGWLALQSPVGPPNPAINNEAICKIDKNRESIYRLHCTRNGLEAAPLHIAYSRENLDKYVGKIVTVYANYLNNDQDTDTIQTNMQCIKDDCKHIFKDKNQKTWAVVIESIRIVDVQEWKDKSTSGD